MPIAEVGFDETELLGYLRVETAITGAHFHACRRDSLHDECQRNITDQDQRRADRYDD